MAARGRALAGPSGGATSAVAGVLGVPPAVVEAGVLVARRTTDRDLQRRRSCRRRRSNSSVRKSPDDEVAGRPTIGSSSSARLTRPPGRDLDRLELADLQVGGVAGAGHRLDGRRLVWSLLANDAMQRAGAVLGADDDGAEHVDARRRGR